MLEADHLVKRFHGTAVVDDVSFALNPGEITGYLGPNGSGKTTTIRMLTGLVQPTSGRVRFNEQDIHYDLVGFHRRVGYVPEEAFLYPFLSGREYLEFVGRLRELPERLLATKISTLLDLLGIGSAAGQSISAYSKGMRQKVLIAAALLHDPDIVIFDEPESGLDVTTALVLRHLVRALAARGKAVLYSSHVLEHVEKLCANVIVLYRGRMVANASVDHLRAVMSGGSLEEVFSQLAMQVDPERVGRDIADVAAQR
jgi:ABC-2 type transport system ATP-binding protein